MIPVDGYVLPLDDILNLADGVRRDIPDALNVPWNEQEIPGIDVPLLDEAAGLLRATAGIVLVHQAALVVHEVVQVAAGAGQALAEVVGGHFQHLGPDCVADFSTIQLEQDGTDRVRFSGIEGKPATDLFKVSVSYSAGWKAVGSLVYAWPDAYRKAQLADRVLRERLDRLGLKFDKTLSEFVGVDACHGQLSGTPSDEIAEVTFRMGVRSEDKRAVEQFTREIAPLVLNGPPTVTGFAGGRPKVEEIIAYWPALIPKSEVRADISVIEA